MTHTTYTIEGSGRGQLWEREVETGLEARRLAYLMLQSRMADVVSIVDPSGRRRWATQTIGRGVLWQDS